MSSVFDIKKFIISPMLTGREKLRNAVYEVAEVAGYLWQKGWAERNGGNITLNVTEFVDDEIRQMHPLTDDIPIGLTCPLVAGMYFYCKGTGKRMRDLARDPMSHGSIIRVSDDGAHYRIIGDKIVQPTCEIMSHLSFHNRFQERGCGYKAVVHTHPTELVAMSHNEAFLGKDVLSRLLWSMIPETRAFCPKGVGVARYAIAGGSDLAKATLEQLDEYDVVLWEKHGAVGVSKNPGEAFDMIDTLVKSSLIYIAAKNMGFEPAGLTAREMNEMKEVFKLPGTVCPEE